MTTSPGRGVGPFYTKYRLTVAAIEIALARGASYMILVGGHGTDRTFATRARAEQELQYYEQTVAALGY